MIYINYSRMQKEGNEKERKRKGKEKQNILEYPIISQKILEDPKTNGNILE